MLPHFHTMILRQRSNLFAITLAAAAVMAGCAEKNRVSASKENTISAVAAAEGFTVRTVISPAKPTVADTLTLSISVESNTTAALHTSPTSPPIALPDAIIWPDVAGAVADTFELADEQDRPLSKTDAGGFILTRIYHLHPILTGTVTIPSLDVQITNDLTVRTDEMPITIRSLLDETEETALAPRKGAADPPRNIRYWIMLGAGAALGAAVLILAVLLLARRRLRRAMTMPLRPAHEIALERLRTLLASDLLAQKAYERFLDELSDILRRYIEDRYGIHAPRQTTEEFLQSARSSHALGIERTAELGHFLKRCDLIKFACAASDRHGADHAVEIVRNFIENSALPETAAEGESSKEPDSPHRPFRAESTT